MCCPAASIASQLLKTPACWKSLPLNSMMWCALKMTMAAKHLVLFGAGMTGRGQIAQLAYEDGWSLTLVDSNLALVDLLRREGRYTVHLVGDGVREVTVLGFRAFHTSEGERIAAALREAGLVVTSVLEPNLP